MKYHYDYTLSIVKRYQYSINRIGMEFRIFGRTTYSILL